MIWSALSIDPAQCGKVRIGPLFSIGKYVRNACSCMCVDDLPWLPSVRGMSAWYKEKYR